MLRTFVPDTSLFSGLKPSSFRLDNFDVMLMDEQPEVKRFLTNGFQHGFSLQRSDTDTWATVTHSNGAMSEEAAHKLQQGVDDDLKRGFICAREDTDGKWQCWPLFMVVKQSNGVPTGKLRRINDFSRSGSDAPSINSNIADHLAAIVYMSTRDLQAQILDLVDTGADNIDVFKFDIQSAFRLMPIRPSDWPSIGFRDTDGTEYYETRLSFGLRQGPRLFSSLSNTVAWLLKAFGLPNTVYLDDFGFACVAVNTDLSRDTARKLFQLLGLPTVDEKDDCGTRVTFLGILHDTVTLTIELTPQRQAALQTQLEEWLAKSTATVHDLQKLTGCLCFATAVIPQGKMFLARCFATLKHAVRLTGKGLMTKQQAKANQRLTIQVGQDLRADIRWWVRFLSHFNGTRKMTKSDPHPTQFLWTDASDTAASGVHQGVYWQLLFSRQDLAWLRRHSIAVREIYAVCVACGTWGNSWVGQHCMFYCDNKGVVDSFDKFKNKNATTQHLMRVICYLSAMHNFTFEFKWLKSKDNPMADIVTRCSIAALQANPLFRGFERIEATWRPPRADDTTWEDDLSDNIIKQAL